MLGYQRQRGATLVEFALVITFLLILSLLIIQYGVIMNTAITLSHLSREGARYAAVRPGTDAAIRSYIQTATPGLIKYSDMTITITPAEGSSTRVSGNPITVTITYNMQRKLFLPSTFFGIPIFSPTYSTKATMLIE
ncbi:MAG: pilus assembly protein [Abditibacteriales bacterium]|nr:pilus assembly protein [Abditibacteriales bacterium]MDW8368385.1 TadE/TadG family type IV pilus assembly protein [Abditibacteriales bacterium]